MLLEFNKVEQPIVKVSAFEAFDLIEHLRSARKTRPDRSSGSQDSGLGAAPYYITITLRRLRSFDSLLRLTSI
jgi:hypothetical protein